MTVYWAPFLHLYQPPWQDVEILRKINDECYLPLLSMLARHDNAKMTLNVQGCLINMLLEHGMQDTVKKLQALVSSGKVEIVGTGIYHPILPLIPKSEVTHQIELNESILFQNFGPTWKKLGFFPPEMAVTPDTCSHIKNLGYEWMIMSGIANTDEWPTNFLQMQGCELITFFRDDYTSNEISFRKIDATGFVGKLSSSPQDPPGQYLITAMDAETFGHHIKNYETSFLGKVFSMIEERSDIKVELISNLKNYFPVKPGTPIRACSWSTDWSDISSNVPFPLWKHPFNPVHKVQYRMLQALYKLMDLVESNYITHVQENNYSQYYQTARWFYDQALHSCWLWWASMRSMWEPNLIYKGADLVLKTALNAQLALVNVHIGDGDEFYQAVIDNFAKLMLEMSEQEISFRKVRTF